VFDWNKTKSLSEIGHQTPILGDGNCGFKAHLEALKEKDLQKNYLKDMSNLPSSPAWIISLMKCTLS